MEYISGRCRATSKIPTMSIQHRAKIRTIHPNPPHIKEVVVKNNWFLTSRTNYKRHPTTFRTINCIINYYIIINHQTICAPCLYTINMSHRILISYPYIIIINHTFSHTNNANSVCLTTIIQKRNHTRVSNGYTLNTNWIRIAICDSISENRPRIIPISKNHRINNNISSIIFNMNTCLCTSYFKTIESHIINTWTIIAINCNTNTLAIIIALNYNPTIMPRINSFSYCNRTISSALNIPNYHFFIINL